MSATNKELTSSREKTIAQANRVAALVDVYDIRLIAQNVRLKNWEKPFPNYGVGHRAEAKRDAERNRIVVHAAFTFELADNDTGSKSDPPASIRAAFALSYEVKDLASLSDEELQAFAVTSGLSNAWPFWRELVYSTMSRMGMPPLTLPTFRLFEDEGSEEKGSEDKASDPATASQQQP